jgi:hypothetical protein
MGGDTVDKRRMKKGSLYFRTTPYNELKKQFIIVACCSSCQVVFAVLLA